MLHNYWLKRKEVKRKSVSVRHDFVPSPLGSESVFPDKQTIVEVELQCGRKFACFAVNGVLTTYNQSYMDPRFYTLREMNSGGFVWNDPVATEPWDENIFSLRQDVVEKIALSYLLACGELKREDYQDSFEYYNNIPTPGYELR